MLRQGLGRGQGVQHKLVDALQQIQGVLGARMSSPDCAIPGAGAASQPL